MTLVLLVGQLHLLGEEGSTSRAHFRMRQVQADNCWKYTLDQIGRLRAQVIVGQVEDLEVEGDVSLPDQGEAVESSDSDATVRKIQLLDQRWHLRGANRLDDR